MQPSRQVGPGERATDPETLERFNRFYVLSLVVNGVAVATNLLVIYRASAYNVYNRVALGMVYVVVRLAFLMAVEVDIQAAVQGHYVLCVAGGLGGVHAVLARPVRLRDQEGDHEPGHVLKEEALMLLREEPVISGSELGCGIRLTGIRGT